MGSADDGLAVVCGGCRRHLLSAVSRYIGMGRKCLERMLASPKKAKESPGQLGLFEVPDATGTDGQGA